jgi:WD40 repeat protein
VSVHEVITNSKFVGSVATAIATASLIGAFKYGRDYLLSLRLKKRLEEDHYTPADIKNRVISNRDPYIRPDCQDNNPANPGSAINRKPIFQEVDRLLGPPLVGRFVLILGDSGMGKSTFLESYYVYRRRSPKRSKHFKPIIVPLNGLDADDLVKAISVQTRGETVLLLDALDEDNAAITDFANRFSKIVEFAGKFRAVVVTCRTQFLADVACVPDEIDLPASSGPMALSGGPDQKVRQIYLAPFSDVQIDKYLTARFPYWRHPILRVRGSGAARRFKDLMSRPLLLTHIEDLASKSEEPRYSFQVYQAIVESWLRREIAKKQLTSRPEDLLSFSEEFAASLYTSGRDRMPDAELQSLAGRFRVKLVPREVRERSLLHNDAEVNWKFAHRSVMEYFLVQGLSTSADRPAWAGKPWTDQMRVFASEMLLSGECKRLPGADLHGVDLTGGGLSDVELSGANLSVANLTGSILRSANLSDAKLTGARLWRARMAAANLRGTSLNYADVSEADLTDAKGLTLERALACISDKDTIWPVRTLAGHTDWVNAVAVTADGKLAVSASRDCTLKVWELDSGRELRTLAGHTDWVYAMAVTADGKLAVSASRDRTLKVWELDTGRELCTLTGHTSAVMAVAVTADGQRAVSASPDNTVRVWELTNGRELRTLTGNSRAVWAVAVTPDGKRAVSASADETLKVWELDTGRELRTLTGHSGSVMDVAVTPDGKLAVSASRDRTLKVWELDTGRELRTLTGHSSSVMAVAVTPDGKLAVSASSDRTLKVWELDTGRELCTLTGHSGEVGAVAVTPDGQRVVSASDDKTLRVWFPPDEPDAPSTS